MCLRCRKAAYAELVDRKRETFLDDCKMCKEKTLHLGPGWCVLCYAESDNMFPLYCEECVGRDGGYAQVVTEIITLVYRISGLNLNGDRIWTLSLILQVSAIDASAENFMERSYSALEWISSSSLHIAETLSSLAEEVRLSQSVRESILGKAPVAKTGLLPKLDAQMSYDS
ncbi:hypothetical protein F66182_6178 [Fusarium sp. NRRL 66182]|nr:hypothetical protein F66182_6178 [Fusarium sp. NRRL 66182]